MSSRSGAVLKSLNERITVSNIIYLLLDPLRMQQDECGRSLKQNGCTGMERTPSGDERRVHGRGLIILFSRLPVAGRVKTRLIPVLGAAGAARLQENLISRTLEVLEDFPGRGEIDLEVHFDGGSERDARRWFGNASLRRQRGRDLGERLRTSAEASFRRGYGKVVIVGADIPDLAERHLRRAFALLSDHDLVLGPANDGGYYLIGLIRTVPELFEGVSWGGPEVLARTLEKARSLDLRVGLIETLRDIDTPEDYRIWMEEKARRRGADP